jgi:hypothetical protein
LAEERDELQSDLDVDENVALETDRLVSSGNVGQNSFIELVAFDK